MNDPRPFEAVTRELRKQEAAGEKVIASIAAFRPAGKAKITLANASIMLGNAESVMRETSALQDELRLGELAAEPKYVERNARALEALHDKLLASAKTLVAAARPVAPLGVCGNIIDTVSQALTNGGQVWVQDDASFAQDLLTSFMLTTFQRDDGGKPSDNKLVLIVSVQYPDLDYVPASARYALTVLYGPMDAYPWEANVLHRSFSVALGAASAAIGSRAVSIIANKLERDDVTLRFHRQPKQARRANEIRADDICGMSELPLAVVDIDTDTCSITVGVALPGVISTQSLVALGHEIKRRTINQLVLTDITVISDGTLKLTLAPNTDLPLAAERLKQLAQNY